MYLLGNMFLLTGCIGEDIISDFVEPQIIIENPIVNLKVGDMYQLNAILLDDTGKPTSGEVFWNSSDEEIMTVSENGLLEGISEGVVTITANSDQIQSSIEIMVSLEETVEMNQRIAEVRTTSSYPLSGTAVLHIESGNSRLELLEDFQTTSALPGLYIYLTNNPNTIDNALELGPVVDFSGAQSYAVSAEVELFTYNYVLFYCKPFVVKVGDGELK